MIRPTGDRVLVALPPREDETTSAGGIVLVKDPDRFYAPTRGIVVALGEKSGTVDVDDVIEALKIRFDPELCPSRIALNVIPSIIASALVVLRPTPFDVEVGDCVLFPQSAGEEIHMDGIYYCLLREAEIIGIVEPLKKDTAA